MSECECECVSLCGVHLFTFDSICGPPIWRQKCVVKYCRAHLRSAFDRLTNDAFYMLIKRTVSVPITMCTQRVRFSCVTRGRPVMQYPVLLRISLSVDSISLSIVPTIRIVPELLLQCPHERGTFERDTFDSRGHKRGAIVVTQELMHRAISAALVHSCVIEFNLSRDAIDVARLWTVRVTEMVRADRRAQCYATVARIIAACQLVSSLNQARRPNTARQPYNHTRPGN